MALIEPNDAAQVAQKIYQISSDFDIPLILNSPLFHKSKSDTKALKADLGFRLFHKRDQFGLCIRGSEKYKNDLFLIFRGTITTKKSDLITDIRMGVNVSATGVMVHAGFNQAFNSMSSDIASFINKQQGVTTIHCIGHSLGGAVANIAADWVKSHFGKDVKLYTFGAPRVGFRSTGFVTKLTSGVGAENIYRAYHSSDPVPMVPLFPYFHAPANNRSYYLPYGGTVNFSAHAIEHYKTSVSKAADWQTLFKPEPGLSLGSIKEWLKTDKNENINSPKTWERLNRAMIYIVQRVLSIAQAPIVGGMTVADYLAMLLQKGIDMAGEAAEWVFLLIRKMMRMLKMKVVESIEALTQQLLRLVLDRITRKIYGEAKKAIDFMPDA